jgi:predicted nucleic acid-binding protein
LKVVSDTSPIIAFSNIGKLHLLKDLFGSITIPRAVHEELSEEKSFRLEEWIDVDEIKDLGLYKMLRADLDHGESEAIALYFEKDMELLLLDDGEARKIAESFEMTIAGTAGLLLLAKRKGLISSVRPEIEKLEKEGAFRLSESVKELLLKEAKER